MSVIEERLRAHDVPLSCANYLTCEEDLKMVRAALGTFHPAFSAALDRLLASRGDPL